MIVCLNKNKTRRKLKKAAHVNAVGLAIRETMCVYTTMRIYIRNVSSGSRFSQRITPTYRFHVVRSGFYLARRGPSAHGASSCRHHHAISTNSGTSECTERTCSISQGKAVKNRVERVFSRRPGNGAHRRMADPRSVPRMLFTPRPAVNLVVCVGEVIAVKKSPM